MLQFGMPVALMKGGGQGSPLAMRHPTLASIGIYICLHASNLALHWRVLVIHDLGSCFGEFDFLKNVACLELLSKINSFLEL